MSKLPRACPAAYQNQLVVARPLHSESGEYTSKSLFHSASQSPLPHAWPDPVKILARVFLEFPLVHRSQVLQLFQCNSYHPSSRGCTPPLSWCWDLREGRATPRGEKHRLARYPPPERALQGIRQEEFLLNERYFGWSRGSWKSQSSSAHPPKISILRPWVPLLPYHGPNISRGGASRPCTQLPLQLCHNCN